MFIVLDATAAAAAVARLLLAPRCHLTLCCCSLRRQHPPAAAVEIAQPNYIAYKATVAPPWRASAWVVEDGVPAATAAAAADAAVQQAAAASASVAAPSSGTSSDGSNSVRAIPNDPRYSESWHLPKISAPEAWEETTGITSVGVCVIDTGASLRLAC